MLSVPDIAMSPVASWYRDELTPPQSQHGHSALSTFHHHEDIQSLPCHCCDHGQCSDELLWPTTGQVMTLIQCTPLIFKRWQLQLKIYSFAYLYISTHFCLHRFRKYNFLLPPSSARPRTYRPPPRMVTTTTQGSVFEFDQKSSFDLAPSGYTLTLLLLGKQDLERQ